MRIPPRCIAALTLSLLLVPAVRAADEENNQLSLIDDRAWRKDPASFDQSKVPLEKDTADKSLKKIVLVAGRASHGPGEHEFFAGSAILMDLLKQTPGVYPVMIRDGWPKDEKVFDGAAAIVLYMDGGAGHPAIVPAHRQVIQKALDAGAGFVNLHYAVEYPGEKDAALKETVLGWLGGYYETGWSINPTWDGKFYTLPDHPIARGVKPFRIKDEWYYNMRWAPDMKGVTPLLKSTPPDDTRRTPEAKSHPGREEVEAWAFDRPGGGRSFGFTGGHYHKNWADENFRRVVANGILWSAKADVPEGGAKVAFDTANLWRNMDKK